MDASNNQQTSTSEIPGSLIGAGSAASSAENNNGNANIEHANAPEKGVFQTEVEVDIELGSGQTLRTRASAVKHGKKNPSFSHSRHMMRRNEKIEDVAFKFSELGPTPLPEMVDIDSVMESVLKSMPFTSGKSRAAWRSHLKSAVCQAIVQDTFWWLFANTFHNDKTQDEQELIFSRVADNYVRLFYQVPSTYKDQFFGRFYDTLAQLMFQTFFQAYPKSRMRFDDSFKMKLVDLCAEWTTGLVPSRPTWFHWAHGQDLKGSKRHHKHDQLTSLGRSSTGTKVGGRGGSSDGNSASAGNTSVSQRWTRAIRTTHTLSYSPLVKRFLTNERHMSSLAFRFALTEDPSRPITTHQGNQKGDRLKKKMGESRKVIETRGGILSHTRQKRNEILREYQVQREETLREISVLRKEHLEDQELMEQKRLEVEKGDVHEYSNYLVSILNAQDEN